MGMTRRLKRVTPVLAASWLLVGLCAGPPAAGQCPQTCPPGGSAEAEPCGQDVNGGCNSSPPRFEPLSCGARVCGSTWAASGRRDTDWYEIRLVATSTVSWTVQTEAVPLALFVASDQCPAPLVAAPGQALACGQGQVQTQLGPGTYRLFVAPGTLSGPIFDGFPCGPDTDYVATLTCDAGTLCPHPMTCGGDVDRNRCVDQRDLGALLAAFGTRPGDAAYNGCADFTGDQYVSQADLGYLLANYGRCCAGTQGTCPGGFCR